MPGAAMDSPEAMVRAELPGAAADDPQAEAGLARPGAGAEGLPPHRLALKVAGVSAAASLAAAAGIAFTLSFHWTLVFIPALVSTGTYWATIRIIGVRLDLARTILREIRKHRFENLEAAHLPRGDELNDLIWQVYRTGQALESELQELRGMEDYRKEFLGNVSHELKTPIFAIRGFAETLLGGALADPSVNRQFLDKLLRNADRLTNLASDLSEISRIETGELKMDPAPFRMRGLVADVLDSLEATARAKGVALSNAVPEDLPPVLGDVEHLRQVATNLVDNAIKYNNPSGTVEVVARATGNAAVKVSVVDDGIGIPAEHVPRITERFYRVDKSRSRSQGGTGLGLAIVKHILAAHGTTLLVESRPGAGSTFGFSLPVAPERDPA